MFKYLTVMGLFLWVQATAQIPEDALRNSWTTPGGTAREQAIGGAMGSIGGDLTAGYVTDYGMLMLAVLLASLPTMVVFLVLQRSFAEGITGAIK